MAEYIRRDDAERALLERCKETGNGGLTPNDIRLVMRTPWRIPAADVVDADECERAYAEGWKNGEEAAESRRKKGKWETAYLDHEAFGVRPHIFYCSKCQQITSFRTFFCQNCGAKMESEDDV